VRKTFRRRKKSLLPPSTPPSQILFLDTGASDPEAEAAWQWLKARFPAARRIFPEQVPRRGQHFVLWWHGARGKGQNAWGKEINWKSLRRFLKSGGKLFLSLAAVQAVAPLGLEKIAPDLAEAGYYDPQSKPENEWIAPQGFEIRGLMGFLAHLPSRENDSAAPDSASRPRTFDLARFGGGIYLWNAKAGASYWRFGYGAKKWPKGNVWGVHRYYIGFDPGQKLAWEYDAPNVLCVGAYLYFSDAQNLFRPQLEAFAEACLRRLLEKGHEKKSWEGTWQPPLAGIKKNNRLIELPRWESWTPVKPLEVSPYLNVEAGRNHFFDLSGDRVLLMGTERGPITEIWSHPLRLCREVSLRIQNAAGETLWENGAEAEVLIRPHQIERRRQTERLSICERIWVGHDAPLAAIDWEFEGDGELFVTLSFEVDFRLMWPYPEGALSKIEYQTQDRRGRVCHSQAHFSDFHRLFCAHFAVAFEREPKARSRWQTETWFDAPPLAVAVDDISEKNASKARVTFHWHLEVKGRQVARFIALGGETNDSSLQELLNTFPEQTPKLYAQQAGRRYHVLEKFAEIDTPDPRFNTAARWAKLKTEAFVGHVPSLGRSLLAGFANTGEGWNAGRPGYAWFFGRDACWTAFAMLHYGDFENVKEVLRFFGRHQEVTGKIFHELTTSGAAHYDAADATPLYVILMGRYLNHSGDLAFVKKEWPHIEKAMAFLETTDRDGDGLIENTGVGHGWIEGGKLFGARVEHYLAGCWTEALHAAIQLATALGKTDLAERWITPHQKALNLLEQDFWNQQAGYFYHGKNSDGAFDANVTALAAVPLLFGYGRPEDGVQALRRLASKAFNAEWGVRLVADDHPFYNPQGYHYGSVWPLFTGWTALAEFRYGRWLQGLTRLQNAMRNFQHGALGCLDEVLHGEIYQPAGVCPHQAWSQSVFLQAIYEGLLGLKPNALAPRLEMAPYLPLHWPFFAAGPISIDEQQLLFFFHREANLLTFQFKVRPFPGRAKRQTQPPLRVDFKPIFPSTAQLAEMRRDHHLIEVKPDERADLIRWPISLEVGEAPVTLTLRLEKFFTVIPPFIEIQPGASRGGCVILDQHIKGKIVTVEVEGEPANRAELEFVLWGYQMKEIKGGQLVASDGERSRIAFVFSQPGSSRYARHTIEIALE
jgi:glycogen debranching enzyme